MQIVNNVSWKQGKINSADDINSLTNGGDSTGTLLIHQGMNIFIPNALKDKQDLIDIITNITKEDQSLFQKFSNYLATSPATPGAPIAPSAASDFVSYNTNIEQYLKNLSDLKNNLK